MFCSVAMGTQRCFSRSASEQGVDLEHHRLHRRAHVVCHDGRELLAQSLKFLDRRNVLVHDYRSDRGAVL